MHNMCTQHVRKRTANVETRKALQALHFENLVLKINNLRCQDFAKSFTSM